MHHQDVDGAAPHAGGADAQTAQRGTDGPLLSTDGHTLFYRSGFADLALPEQAGRVAHAVLHIALRHVPRFVALHALHVLTGDADLRLFNVCADAIVNSPPGHLGWLQLPVDAVQLHSLLAQALGQPQPVASALLEWDVERLYRAIDDRRPVPQAAVAGAGQREDRQRRDGPRQDGQRQGGQSRGGQGKVGQGGDGQHGDAQRGHGTPDCPNRAAVQRDAPEAEAALALAWRERLLRAHASDRDFSMLRALLADLPHSRTHWEPGTSASQRVPRLALVVDVSGSEPESFSGVTEQRARKAFDLGAKRSHSPGYGEHLQ